MEFVFAYQLQFENRDQMLVTINIYDTKSGLGTPNYTPIDGSGAALRMSVTDTDEEKFSPIKAKKAEISFLSTGSVNLNSFIDSEDNRWYVEIFFDTQIKFCGYLIQDEDLQEDYLDSEFSNEVKLTATDNIGLLKDIPLITPAGQNPRGTFRIMSYIAWCLQRTGLNLNINVVHNVHEEHTPAKIMFESCWLQSKTFEAEINVSVDCYTALEMILHPYCYVTQHNGEWWIISVDDLQDNETVYHKFDLHGVWVSQGVFNPLQTFAPDSQLEFSGKATFIKAKGTAKEVKLTYNYAYPEEIIDNIDFSRGSLVQDLGNTKEYSLDDWTLKINNVGTQLNTTTLGRAFITRKFEDGYEKERYAVIQNPGAANTRPYFLSAAKIPIHVNDKFDLSVDSRYNADPGGSGFYRHATMHVLLRGDNGNVWTLHGGTSVDPDPVWVLGSNFYYIVTEGNQTTDDLREWKTVYKTTSYPACPATGDLEISLVYNNVLGNEKYFSNLRFTYMPFINGSYAKYKGQHNKVSQNVNNRKVINENVTISDSPKKLFKGALFYHTGTKFALAGKFYDGRQYPTAPPADLTHRKPYGTMQAFTVWNQNNRPFRVFDLQSQGLSSEPDVTDKYVVGENNLHTNNKYFMLLHFDQDVYSGEMSGVMTEVWDTTKPKDYASPFEFKYITDAT